MLDVYRSVILPFYDGKAKKIAVSTSFFCEYMKIGIHVLQPTLQNKFHTHQHTHNFLTIQILLCFMFFCTVEHATFAFVFSLNIVQSFVQVGG
jgi:hypothetical protein